MDKLPVEKVIVKVSYCTKCNGYATIAILHMMDAKGLREFEKEVVKYKLAVKHIPLIEHRESDYKFCSC